MFDKIKNYVSVLILAIAGWFAIFNFIKVIINVNALNPYTEKVSGAMALVGFGLFLTVFFFIKYFPLILFVLLEDYLKSKSKFTYKIKIHSPIYYKFIKIGLFGLLAPIIQSILMALSFV
jgi:hypothetical protein